MNDLAFPKVYSHTRVKDGVFRSQKHLAFVRNHPCVASDGLCGGPIQAAHVRRGTDGGMGIKPSDFWTLPICRDHHAQQHKQGEQSFEAAQGVNMKSIARRLAKKSPYVPDELAEAM